MPFSNKQILVEQIAQKDADLIKYLDQIDEKIEENSMKKIESILNFEIANKIGKHHKNLFDQFENMNLINEKDLLNT